MSTRNSRPWLSFDGHFLAGNPVFSPTEPPSCLKALVEAATDKCLLRIPVNTEPTSTSTCNVVPSLQHYFYLSTQACEYHYEQNANLESLFLFRLLSPVESKRRKRQRPPYSQLPVHMRPTEHAVTLSILWKNPLGSNYANSGDQNEDEDEENQQLEKTVHAAALFYLLSLPDEHFDQVAPVDDTLFPLSVAQTRQILQPTATMKPQNRLLHLVYYSYTAEQSMILAQTTIPIYLSLSSLEDSGAAFVEAYTTRAKGTGPQHLHLAFSFSTDNALPISGDCLLCRVLQSLNVKSFLWTRARLTQAAVDALQYAVMESLYIATVCTKNPSAWNAITAVGPRLRQLWQRSNNSLRHLRIGCQVALFAGNDEVDERSRNSSDSSSLDDEDEENDLLADLKSSQAMEYLIHPLLLLKNDSTPTSLRSIELEFVAPLVDEDYVLSLLRKNQQWEYFSIPRLSTTAKQRMLGQWGIYHLYLRHSKARDEDEKVWRLLLANKQRNPHVIWSTLTRYVAHVVKHLEGQDEHHSL